MTLQLDPHADTAVFSTLVEVEMTDTDRSLKGNWKSETRLSMLSHELARYMPELADMLAQSGRQKMLAA
jgi:acetoacetate decarboxylase